MAKKPDVGMAGSSGYKSEFYNTNSVGQVMPNARTMKLQGMNPRARTEASQKQEARVRGRAEAGLGMSDRDKARMKAVGGDNLSYGRVDNENYDESDFQDAIRYDDEDKRERAASRGEAVDTLIRNQRAKYNASQKFGDNSFKSAAPMTKAMMADYKKKNK
jgi:hypothetical protein